MNSRSSFPHDICAKLTKNIWHISLDFYTVKLFLSATYHQRILLCNFQFQSSFAGYFWWSILFFFFLILQIRREYKLVVTPSTWREFAGLSSERRGTRGRGSRRAAGGWSSLCRGIHTASSPAPASYLFNVSFALVTIQIGPSLSLLYLAMERQTYANA